MITKKTILTTSIALSLCAQIQAQQTDSQSLSKVETITILGSRIQSDISQLPASVSILTSDFIEQSGAVFVTDLLRNFASMNISQSGPAGSLTEIRFRGSESNHILVMIDGVEINDLGQAGIADLAHLQTSDIAQIELLRGPQSALWGANAISGVINITTKGYANNKGLNVETQDEIGSQQTFRGGINLSKSDKQQSLGINLSHFQTDGFNISRESKLIDQQNTNNEDDGYTNTSLSGHYKTQLDKHNTLTFNARLAIYESDFDATDFVNTGLPVDADNVSKGEQNSAHLKWQYKNVDSRLSHQASVQRSSQSVENFNADTLSAGTTGTKLRVNWISTLSFAQQHFLNLGLDWSDEDFEQVGPIVFGDPNQRQNNKTTSLTSDGRYFINEHINATASLRFDKSDEFEDATSYRLGFNAVLSENLRAFIATGKAIKNPTFTERFGFFPDSFIGNAALEPEQSLSKEIGVVYDQDSYDVAITLFDTKLDNEINGFVFEPTLGNFTAQNSALESTRKGLEISASGQISQISWQANYAYLDAQDAQADELRRANHTGAVSLSYHINDQHVSFVQASYTGSRLDRFFPPFPNPSEIVGLNAYWLVNFTHTYRYDDNLSLSLRATNLTNQSYEDIVGFVGQGRQLRLNLSYQF